MKTISLGKSSLTASRLAYGCWRIGGTMNASEVTPARISAGKRAVVSAFQAGYTLYDLADIYCDGMSETIFGEALREVSGMREQVLIATKCGIRKPGQPTADAPYRYDFSADYILSSCDASLKRLGVERIDIYQLHRPDWLMDPTEVAVAFAKLSLAGKVREFGVSNFRPSQVALLNQACSRPLIVNQVEISLAQLRCFEDGTLDQCLAERIVPMAWSPLGGGHLADGAKNVLRSQEGYRSESLLQALDALATEHGVTRSIVALAWLLRHPSGIVPIVGSTDPDKISAAVRALDCELSREEWYRLLEAARGDKLP
jgi:predicted oxidoreductase